MPPFVIDFIRISPLSSVVIAVILVGWLLCLARLFVRFFQINGPLKRAARFLQDVAAGAALSRFSEIDNFFRATSRLSQPWIEYNESLLRSPDHLASTWEASQFFAADRIVEEPMRADVNRHLPGMFTALGLIGTFIGIYLGVQRSALTLQNAGTAKLDEALQSTLSALLTDIAPAFLAALFAVSAAVIFMLFERVTLASLLSHLHELQHQLDRLFRRATPEGFLKEILDQSQEQSKALKNFSTDLSGVLEHSMGLLLMQQLSELKDANRALVQEVASSVSTQLLPVADRLKKAVREMKEVQATSTQETMQRLVDQFTGALTAKANVHFAEMASATAEAAETLGTVKTELQQFLRSLNEQTQKQNSFISDELARLALEAAETREEAQHSLEMSLSKLGQQLSEGQERLTAGAAEAMEGARRKLATMIERSIETQEEISTRLTGSVGTLEQHLFDMVDRSLASQDKIGSQVAAGVSDELNRLAERLAESTSRGVEQITRLQKDTVENLAGLVATAQGTMDERLHTLTATIGDTVADHVKKLGSGISRVVGELHTTTQGMVTDLATRVTGTSQEAFASLKTTTESTLAVVSSTVESSLSQASEGLTNLFIEATTLNKQLRERFEQLAKMVENLSSTTFTNTTALTEMLNYATEKTAALVEAQGNIMESNAAHMSQYRDTAVKMANVIHELERSSVHLTQFSSTFQDIAGTLDQVSANFQSQAEVSDHQTEKLESLVAGLGDATVSMEQTTKLLTTSLHQYHQAVDSALSNYLGKVDEYLSRAAGTLGANVSEFGEKVEELTTAIGQLPVKGRK